MSHGIELRVEAAPQLGGGGLAARDPALAHARAPRRRGEPAEDQTRRVERTEAAELDPVQTRRDFLIGHSLCGLGWAGMGYVTSLPMLYAMYCLAGIGAAFVYSGSIGSALKWFKDKRGLASGIMADGFGGGTALFIPFIQSMIATRGYQATFIATGIFFLGRLITTGQI